MPKSIPSYRAIGLMSGSSLDGLDICFCEYHFNRDNNSQNKWEYKILATKTANLGIWDKKLTSAISLTEIELNQLSKDFARYLAKEVNNFISDNQIVKIDAIVSHGHTIYHYPDEGRTCQIGDGQVLADMTGILVVNNLRQADMDNGGQGAPIVPIGDKFLFGKYAFCLNIGGIANISAKVKEDIIAFDVCAANQVLNYYANQLGNPYDDKGLWAREGEINHVLLDHLSKLEYYKQEFPKSLDNSFSKQIILEVNAMEPNVKNALCTYVEHIALQLACDLERIAKQYMLPLSETATILITGGGAFNEYLIERIAKHLPLKIEIPTPAIINYKEALVMGFIGILKLRNEINVLSSVSGASKDSSCGDVFSPKSPKLI